MMRRHVTSTCKVLSRCSSKKIISRFHKTSLSHDIEMQQDLEGAKKPVWSWNEWNSLEEVIVGRIEGVRVPKLEPCIKSKITPEAWPWVEANAGKKIEGEEMNRAAKQVDEFCRVLEMEGVTVKRPEIIKWDELGEFKLPYFSEGGRGITCPRDGLMVVGDEFIESATAWRSRYFEMFAYKKLLTEYFNLGAKWVCAPKPTIRDEMFVQDYPYDNVEKRREMAHRGQFILNETEIAFDAADAIRFGKDIFIVYSHNTNRCGAEWLKRHMQQKDINVHTVLYEGIFNCHADATFVPIKPGILLVNPNEPILQVNDEPCGWDYFTRRGWKVVPAPAPVVCKFDLFVHDWIHVNMLSLDEERIIIQKGEEPLKNLLISLGMKPIEVNMIDAFGLGGAFHCWTVDVKRIGKMDSYF